MSRLWGIAFAALAILPTPGTAQDPKSQEIVKGRTGAAMDKAVRSYDKDDGGFCGAVLVAVKGKIILEKGYGLADKKKNLPIRPNALWDWASVSKQFTAAAILKLQDQKKLRLDDPLSKFYRDVPRNKAKVTLRQMLNHTSGIQAGFRNDWNFDASKRESLEKLVLNLPMTSKPGEKWEYSNSTYALVAAIIERVSKMSFEEYCVKHLFRPAKMKDASFIGWPDLDKSRVPRINRGEGFQGRRSGTSFAYGDRLSWGYRGCGGTVASIRDLYRWDRALRGTKVLSKKALTEYYKTSLRNYALGWQVRKDGDKLIVHHSGSVQGVNVVYYRLLDEDIVVILAFSYKVNKNPNRLANQLIAIARR